MICFLSQEPKSYSEHEKQNSWAKVVSGFLSFSIVESSGNSCRINQAKISIKEEALGSSAKDIQSHKERTLKKKKTEIKKQKSSPYASQ